MEAEGNKQKILAVYRPYSINYTNCSLANHWQEQVRRSKEWRKEAGHVPPTNSGTSQQQGHLDLHLLCISSPDRFPAGVTEASPHFG